MILSVLQLLLIIQVIKRIDGSTPDLPSPEKLIKHFIKDGGVIKKEDRHIPPTKAVVKTRLVIYSILGINQQEILDIYGWVSTQWTDPRLKWNPGNWTNITRIMLPKSYLWVPDIGIWNSITAGQNDLLQSKGLLSLEVNHKGHVQAYSNFISRTPCTIYGFFYPFDEQTCRLMLGTIASTVQEFKLVFEGLDISLTRVDPIGEWYFKNYSVNITGADSALGGSNYVYNKVYIHLRRKPLYHILLVILPFSLLSIMASVLFFLKHNNDRFNIAVAILLSMTLYIVIASQNAPKSMQRIPIMGIFLLNQMALLILLSLLSVVWPVLVRFCSKSSNIEAQQTSETVERKSKGCCAKVNSSVGFLIAYLILTFFNAIIFLLIVPHVQAI